MRSVSLLVAFPVISAFAAALVGCGPSHVQLDPKEVVNVNVRPASGQLLYCPGDRFQIEVVAKLKNGQSCSSTDRKLGCMGKEDAVIDPQLVRVEASHATPSGDASDFVWMPDPNPLTTADTGIHLRGWLEGAVGGQASKSMEGEADIKPVYECERENLFVEPQRGFQGEPGRAGPNLDIAITSLSTPYYPNAALIRVDSGSTRVYLISPSADQPVRIVSKGQSGAPGVHGADGQRGDDGKDAKTACENGAKGGDGAPGGAGGPGGDGGAGGVIRVLLDQRVANELKGRVLLASVGGDAGPGGLGGHGGFGGDGGRGGPSGPSCASGGNKGDRGRDGQNGQDGPMGRRGPDGAPPTFEAASREELFGTEMSIIQRIEAAKGKR